MSPYIQSYFGPMTQISMPSENSLKAKQQHKDVQKRRINKDGIMFHFIFAFFYSTYVISELFGNMFECVPYFTRRMILIHVFYFEFLFLIYIFLCCFV